MPDNTSTSGSNPARDPSDEAQPTPVVFIVGAGVVGTALGTCLVRAGVEVAGLHGRRVDSSDATSPVADVRWTTGELPASIAEADVILVAVRDDRIPGVAERLVREARLNHEQVLLHTSGAHAAGAVLFAARPHVRGVGTMHPLVSFADPRLAAEQMSAVAFGLEGDPPARAQARILIERMGARAVEIAAENLPLYHAGAVLVSNYVVALAELARGLLVAAGVPEGEALPALIPLMSSVVQNLAQMGLPAALTGPVERGDVSTVESHLEILRRRSPGVVELYRQLGREVLRLALKKSPLDADPVARFRALFGGD